MAKHHALANSAALWYLRPVPPTQHLLFPDPRPLVERLGREFFRQLPERPGVYLMRDARNTVLYVGKAKNLRKRLGSYRVANPDRMARRHLRLLRAVERIELQECADEFAALARESELLRALKPKFNRAGTWPSKARYLVCRCDETRIELGVTETPKPDDLQFGPMGVGAIYLRAVLLRLLWFATFPELGMARMPQGWMAGRLENPAILHCQNGHSELTACVTHLFAGRVETFCEYVRQRVQPGAHPFDKAVMEADLESVAEAFCYPRTSLKAISIDSAV